VKRVSFEDGIIYSFRPDLEPVATARSGETVEFVCQDACGGRIRSEKDTLESLDLEHVNGATGPVRVMGSRPGDALRVRTAKLVIPKSLMRRLVPR